MAIFETIFSFFFLSNFKNTVVKKNKIQTHLAPQNDRLNLIFLENINVVSNKMTRNGLEMINPKSCQFFTQTDLLIQIF